MSSVGIPGDPGQLLSSADQFAAIAQHLDDTQNQILGASNQATSSWQSQGAFAFTGASNWLQASVSNAGQGFEQAAVATRAYGNALQQAQDGWNKCNQELHQLQSDLQTANAQLAQAEATNAQRANANMAAAVFTAGLPSAGALFAPAPAALPMINTAPIQAHIDQLKADIQRVQNQMRVFEADAEQAARTYAGTLDVASNKGSSGGGILGSVEGTVGDLLSGGAQAITDINSTAAQFGQGTLSFFSALGGGIGSRGYQMFEAIIHGRYTQYQLESEIQSAKQTDQIINDPEGTAKAMLDWNDLTQGKYAHWAGYMAPSMAAVVFSDGGAATEKLAETESTISRFTPADEYGPIELGDGRQLTSHVPSGMPHGVTVDLVSHPNGSQTLTLFGRNGEDTSIAQNVWSNKPPVGIDTVSIHGDTHSAAVMGDGGVQREVSPQDLAAITQQHGLGGCAVTLLSCNTGQVGGGYAQQYSDALGGQTVFAPTDYYYPVGNQVGYMHQSGAFLSTVNPWRTFGGGVPPTP